MTARFRSWWQKIRQHPFIVAGIIVVIFAITAFAIGVIKFGWDWTGFTGGESKVTTTIFTPGTTTATPGTTVATEQQSAKTLWDWLGLLAVLAIPIVVGFGAAWFTAQQVKVSDRENKDNQLEAALQSYIDKMSEYLMEQKLRDSNPEDEVRKIARVRTLTTLPRLDARRKGIMLNFLNEAGLIDKDKCLIDLSGGISTSVYGADLEGAYLPGRNLRRTNLSSVFLSKANLTEANLTEANLTEANLSGANLSRAKLSGAKLSGAYMSKTKLIRADLNGADLSGANLSGAKLLLADLNGVDLSGADLTLAELHLSGWNVILAVSFLRYLSTRNLSTDDPNTVFLSRANLSKVKLSKAKLSKVDLYGADLSEADLSEADLSRAYLSRANLKGVTGITVEELEKQAKSLKGATMPDGSIHP